MEQRKEFGDLAIEDKTSEIGMMTFQGQATKGVLEKIVRLPRSLEKSVKDKSSRKDLGHDIENWLYWRAHRF